MMQSIFGGRIMLEKGCTMRVLLKLAMDRDLHFILPFERASVGGKGVDRAGARKEP